METTLHVFAEADKDTQVPTTAFARKVMAILRNPAGWPRTGIRFVPAPNPQEADLWIRLARNTTVKRTCGFDKMSCAWVGGKRSLINLERWLAGSDGSVFGEKTAQGAVSADGLMKYHTYVINHETGHLLGLDDQKSPGVGVTAPVMLQHTLGEKLLQGARANYMPLQSEIDAVRQKGPARLVVRKAAFRGGSRKKKSTKKKKK